MTILRSGPSKDYSNNWASAFGKKKATKSEPKKAKSNTKNGKGKKSSKKK